MDKIRCGWLTKDPLYIKYHDKEWGVACHNDRKLFEMLMLEGFQAGLSWITILKKRENFKAAFDNFDPKIIAKYGSTKLNQLMKNEGVIRNRLKINAAKINAKCFLEVKQEFGTFDKYIWQFVEGKPIKNQFKYLKQIPSKTEKSDEMSRDLKKRGFKFVGSTICYAFMQATGMVNDHITECFRYDEIK
jgi:DNA-3-methyladenine glycosylase I